jgi:anti-sigma factor RsiW
LAGALEAEETSLVAEHLEACSECRAEVRSERELRDAVRAAATPRIAPHSSSFARLMERVEAAERRRFGSGLRRLGSALGASARTSTGWLTARRLRVAGLVLANNVVLVLAVIAILRLPANDQAAPRFETRSAERALDAHRLRLVFRDDVAMWEVVDLLRELELELVAGPSQVGAFEVEARGERDLGAVVETLRKDARVRLVAGWP